MDVLADFELTFRLLRFAGHAEDSTPGWGALPFRPPKAARKKSLADEQKVPSK